VRKNRAPRKPRFCQWVEGPRSPNNYWAIQFCRERPEAKVYCHGRFVGWVCGGHAISAREHDWQTTEISNRPQGQKGDK